MVSTPSRESIPTPSMKARLNVCLTRGPCPTRWNFGTAVRNDLRALGLNCGMEEYVGRRRDDFSDTGSNVVGNDDILDACFDVVRESYDPRGRNRH